MSGWSKFTLNRHKMRMAIMGKLCTSNTMTTERPRSVRDPLLYYSVMDSYLTFFIAIRARM